MHMLPLPQSENAPNTKAFSIFYLTGLSMPGIPSALASLGVGHSGMAAAAAAAAASRLGLSGLTATSGHNVLLVSNLNPEVSTPEHIYVLLEQRWAALKALFTLGFVKLEPLLSPCDHTS